jgi:hypothetical protein
VTGGLESICGGIPESTLQAICEKVTADPTGLVAAVVAALIVAIVKPVRGWLWGAAKDPTNNNSYRFDVRRGLIV